MNQRNESHRHRERWKEEELIEIEISKFQNRKLFSNCTAVKFERIQSESEKQAFNYWMIDKVARIDKIDKVVAKIINYYALNGI